jgi:hypothetical protein
VDNGNETTPEDNGSESSGDNKKIILIVGAVAVVLAIILIIALMPREPEVDPYVVQLESEVSMFTGQIDSLNVVVDGLNGRLDTVRSQMDSSRASNRRLLSSLHNVTNELREYKSLYKEQQELNKKLVSELTQVRVEKDRATTEVKELKVEFDKINTALYEKTTRLVRLEASLEDAMDQAKTMKETATSVLVFVGTEDQLKEAGYLKAGRSFFRKNYKLIGFPDVADTKKKTGVLKISMGETLALSGELDVLADRHGKLNKGDEYEVSKGPAGQTLVTFIDATLEGQRILAVLKKDK